MRPRSVRGPVLLGVSIASEVLGTLLLRVSDGFTRPLPSLGVLGGYLVSILLFSRALEHGLTLGIAYGTLTGCGLLAATVFSAVLFGAPLGAVQVVGLVLILLGALVLQVDTSPAREAGG